MTLWQKLKKRFRKAPAPPDPWPRKSKPGSAAAPQPPTTWKIPAERKPGRKLRIPGLRTFKRFIAFLLMVFHFIIGELALTGPAVNQPLALIFLVTAFLLADYLWKTRKKPRAFEGAETE